MNEVENIVIVSPIYSHRHRLNTQSITKIRELKAFNVITVEMFGISEVARARCRVATKAVKVLEQLDVDKTLVLWFDADMVIVKPQTFLNHVALVAHTEKAISGRAIVRQSANKVAASKIDDGRTPIHYDIGENEALLTPLLVGMGCLLMPAKLFLDQAMTSPRMLDEQGEVEYLVCCPRIEPHEKYGHVMISEDFDYCRSVPGGTWYGEVIIEDTIERLDYGHVMEQVAIHSNTATLEE